MGLHRAHPEAQSHLTALPVFEALLQDQADAKRGRLERMLGANLEPLLEALRERLAAEDPPKSLGGKKEAGEFENLRVWTAAGAHERCNTHHAPQCLHHCLHYPHRPHRPPHPPPCLHQE